MGVISGKLSYERLPNVQMYYIIVIRNAFRQISFVHRPFPFVMKLLSLPTTFLSFPPIFFSSACSFSTGCRETMRSSLRGSSDSLLGGSTDSLLSMSAGAAADDSISLFVSREFDPNQFVSAAVKGNNIAASKWQADQGNAPRTLLLWSLMCLICLRCRRNRPANQIRGAQSAESQRQSERETENG